MSKRAASFAEVWGFLAPFTAAGVRTDTAMGRAWAAHYRGPMTVEAIAAEWAEVEP
jgi:hypothetical protein